MHLLQEWRHQNNGIVTQGADVGDGLPDVEDMLQYGVVEGDLVLGRKFLW